MVFMSIFSDCLDKIDKYCCRKYVLDDVHFTRKRKIWIDDLIIHLLASQNRANVVECLSFYQELKRDDFVTITPQAFSDKRQYLDPLVFFDMNSDVMCEIYNKSDELKEFKGYIIFGCDTSVVDCPNTPLTKKEMEVPEDNVVTQYLSRARISAITDDLNHFILSSEIAPKKTSEISLAINHINDLKDKININKTIIVYDRGYNSTQLMLHHLINNSHFIIRLKKDSYKNQRAKMISNDEKIEIKIKKIHKKDLTPEEKTIAKKIGNPQLRVVNIPIKKRDGTQYIESLITDLPEDTFTPEDLKKLYGTRWETETNFNRLKNRLDIENFSGQKRITIEQDFYSHIFIFNLLMATLNDATQKINRKSKKEVQEKLEYKPNLNTIIGLIRKNILKLIFEDQTTKTKIIHFITEIASKSLVTTKKNPPTNTNNRQSKDTTNKHPGNYRKP